MSVVFSVRFSWWRARAAMSELNRAGATSGQGRDSLYPARNASVRDLEPRTPGRCPGNLWAPGHSPARRSRSAASGPRGQDGAGPAASCCSRADNLPSAADRRSVRQVRRERPATHSNSKQTRRPCPARPSSTRVANSPSVLASTSGTHTPCRRSRRCQAASTAAVPDHYAAPFHRPDPHSRNRADAVP